MLDRISNTGGVSPTSPGSIDPAQQRKSEETQQKFTIADSGKKDSTQISGDAAEISRYQEMARIHREAFGEVDRSEKLRQVQERIQSGFYDSDEVLDNISERVVEATAGDAGQAKDINTVQRRAEEGYYDRPEVVDKTAENLLKQVWPRR